jgi:hypothetical protein
MIDNLFMTRDLKLPLRDNGTLQDRLSSRRGQLPTDDEAIPWSRSDHLVGTRWLSSSEDSSNNFSGTL